MDPTQQSGNGVDASTPADTTWLTARVGNAIDVYIDRTLNAPQVVYDASQAYGVNADGTLYQLGQNNTQVVKPGGVNGGNSNLMLLVLLGVILAVHH